MITCELNGRMGNQMFQIAAVIGTALKYGVPYSIPKRTLNDLFPVYFTYPNHHAAPMFHQTLEIHPASSGMWYQ